MVVIVINNILLLLYVSLNAESSFVGIIMMDGKGLFSCTVCNLISYPRETVEHNYRATKLLEMKKKHNHVPKGANYSGIDCRLNVRNKPLEQKWSCCFVVLQFIQ